MWLIYPAFDICAHHQPVLSEHQEKGHKMIWEHHD
jgi:hypothetical protein